MEPGSLEYNSLAHYFTGGLSREKFDLTLVLWKESGAKPLHGDSSCREILRTPLAYEVPLLSAKEMCLCWVAALRADTTPEGQAAWETYRLYESIHSVTQRHSRQGSAPRLQELLGLRERLVSLESVREEVIRCGLETFLDQTLAEAQRRIVPLEEYYCSESARERLGAGHGSGSQDPHLVAVHLPSMYLLSSTHQRELIEAWRPLGTTWQMWAVFPAPHWLLQALEPLETYSPAQGARLLPGDTPQIQETALGLWDHEAALDDMGTPGALQNLQAALEAARKI